MALTITADHVVAKLLTGYVIRSMRAKEKIDRVAVHRNAWPPATLEATSRFILEQFNEVQKTRLHDEQLNFAVEDLDGTLVAYCTIWWDPSIEVAEIEPPGVIPGDRRLRVAAALVTVAVNQFS